MRNAREREERLRLRQERAGEPAGEDASEVIAGASWHSASTQPSSSRTAPARGVIREAPSARPPSKRTAVTAPSPSNGCE